MFTPGHRLVDAEATPGSLRWTGGSSVGRVFINRKIYVYIHIHIYR